jgi:hypothetical protein
MSHGQTEIPEIQKTLRQFREHRRLVGLVKTMALEIERLDDDNVQLRAAASMYREAIRRAADKASSTSLRSA